MDKRKNNKGTIGNKGGRPPKADEEKVNYLFCAAIKRIHKKDEDDEAKIEFIKELNKTARGQIFIAEHIFGKPKQIIDQITKIEPLNYTEEERDNRIEQLLKKV